MSPSAYTPEPKILQLLGELCAEDISAEDAALLLSRLQTDERLREFYVAYLNLHAELVWRTVSREIPADAVPWTDELLLPVRPRPSLRISPVWLAVAATLMLVAYFVGLPAMIGWERAWRMAAGVINEDRQLHRVVASEPVATIRDSVDAQWSRSTDKLEIRNQQSEISAGEPLAIDSGLVELELKQGVTLLIAGPADWSIDGQNNATLKRGKLFAKVPQQAIGFTLETPAGKIVDLGTEFGVEVADDGTSTVSVVKGQVDANAHGGRSITLSAGDGVRLQQAKLPTLVRADISTFADMKSRLKRSGKVLLFSDNFDVQTHRMTINPDVSQDSPSRYGGEVGRLSYVEKPAVTDATEWASQLNHPVIPMALSVSASADRMRTSLSPDVDFRAEHPAGVRFWLECDMKPLAAEENGAAIDSWGALVFASENIAADYWDPHVMALLVRPDGKYSVADSTDGTPQDIASGDLVRDHQLPSTGWRKVRVGYTVARFDGTKPSNVEIEIDGKLIAKFTSKRSPRANHVTMQAFAARGVASCGFDNLKVWSEPMGGEP